MNTKQQYELNAKVLTHKYGDIMADYQDRADDRRIAYNMYQQILKACKDMAASGIDNSFIRSAVNEAIHAQEQEIDEIITRFTGKVYKDFTWVE